MIWLIFFVIHFFQSVHKLTWFCKDYGGMKYMFYFAMCSTINRGYIPFVNRLIFLLLIINRFDPPQIHSKLQNRPTNWKHFHWWCDICPTDISPTDSCPTDICPTWTFVPMGHLSHWGFCPLRLLQGSLGLFFC